MFYVFDLDGTLADATHRLHHIQKSPKDWDGFYSAQWQDSPIPSIVNVLFAVYRLGHRVEIWTGRSDDTEQQTRKWLAEQGIGHWWPRLRMRKAGDHRPDYEVKAEWLREGDYPDLIFEDRRAMVDMWRSKGIRVAHVAEGNY